MKSLSNSIYKHYTDNFESLPFDKQLHFASRLFLWSEDEFGATQLAKLRPAVTADEHADVAIREVYAHGQETIHHGSKNAAELRAPYFKKYPQLRTLAMVLFRLTFLETIYGIDARQTLYELFDKAEIESLLNSLLADTEALAILSTHAVNVLYLYNRVVLKDDTALNPDQFLQLGPQIYDLTNPIELQLYIYLYTHCIIGESKFYARQLPEHYLSTYQQMTRELEDTMDANFESINLDNKFEFLVCCKLVGHESTLAQRIENEAKASVSTDGMYLIDRHNNNPQTANTTLDLSEHRNVLYLLFHLDSSLAR